MYDTGASSNSPSARCEGCNSRGLAWNCLELLSVFIYINGTSVRKRTTFKYKFSRQVHFCRHANHHRAGPLAYSETKRVTLESYEALLNSGSCSVGLEISVRKIASFGLPNHQVTRQIYIQRLWQIFNVNQDYPSGIASKFAWPIAGIISFFRDRDRN